MDEDDDHKALLAGHYDASAAAYEAHWAPALANVAQAFVEELPLANAERILDVGAGTGRLLDHLRRTVPATGYGIDRSLGMLRHGPADCHRAVMDAERLAFRDSVFDAALAMFVLFHLPDPARGLKEMRRVLKPRGLVAFTTWGEDDPDFRAFDVFDEVLDRYGAAEARRSFSRYDLIESPDKCGALLEACGFSVSSVRSDRTAYQWTVEHLIGFRTEAGCGRVRWESLDAPTKSVALQEGREALQELSPDELVLRDEVIYAVAIAT